MRNNLLIIFLMMFAVFQAQIVNIPDAAFKAKLLSADVTNSIATGISSGGLNIKIDANNNGEIEVSEAQQVNVLRLYGGGITDVTGIAAFSNLGMLDISGNNMTSLNLSSNTSLGELNIDASNQLTSVNLTNCNSLVRIFCNSLSLTSLNLENKPQLKYVYIFSPLTTFSVSGSTQIIELNVENTQLTTFDASNLQKIFVFYVRNNPLLSNINFTNANMEIIDISKNNLSSVSIQNQSFLRTVDCSQNHLTSFYAPGCPDMRIITCYNNLLTGLNLSTYPLLTTLDCHNNTIQSLDLSQNPEFYSINCATNGMTFLNLKNGRSQQNNSTSVGYNPNLVICCDESERTMLQNMISGNPSFFPNYQITSYCSFTPGGTFYTVQGNTKYDSNNNGCDINDPNKPFQKFNITNGTQSGSSIGNGSGNYSIPVGAGNHTVTPVLENPSYFNISPSTLTVTFPTQSSPFTQNFCLTANGTHHDLEAVIVPITSARPGFNATYKIVYKNKGNTTQSGTVSFNYNDNVTDYLSSTVSPNSQSAGSLNWNFTNLLPFETRAITVTLKLNTPTQVPAVNGGDILHHTAQVNGAVDETPADNTFTLNQTVVNSFDPNDKTCLEGTTITQAQVGDYVHYVIRFENTGTANAQNIVVKDEINTSKFDLSTLIPLNASHNFVARVTSPNVVEFIFENIQLPFDDANNDGYVSFKIKTKSTLNVGDSFSNLAKIYFDYNAPITTNTYTTTVQNVLATSETGKENSSISIYPNPVKDVLNIRSRNEIVKAEIYDAAGRIVMAVPVKGNAIGVAGLTKGNYIIKLSSKDKTFTQKFIKN
jgi:hypothetical protein